MVSVSVAMASLVLALQALLPEGIIGYEGSHFYIFIAEKYAPYCRGIVILVTGLLRELGFLVESRFELRSSENTQFVEIAAVGSCGELVLCFWLDRRLSNIEFRDELIRHLGGGELYFYCINFLVSR